MKIQKINLIEFSINNENYDEEDEDEKKIRYLFLLIIFSVKRTTHVKILKIERFQTHFHKISLNISRICTIFVCFVISLKSELQLSL